MGLFLVGFFFSWFFIPQNEKRIIRKIILVKNVMISDPDKNGYCLSVKHSKLTDWRCGKVIGPKETLKKP